MSINGCTLAPRLFSRFSNPFCCHMDIVSKKKERFWKACMTLCFGCNCFDFLDLSAPTPWEPDPVPRFFVALRESGMREEEPAPLRLSDSQDIDISPLSLISELNCWLTAGPASVSTDCTPKSNLVRVLRAGTVCAGHITGWERAPASFPLVFCEICVLPVLPTLKRESCSPQLLFRICMCDERDRKRRPVCTWVAIHSVCSWHPHTLCWHTPCLLDTWTPWEQTLCVLNTCIVTYTLFPLLTSVQVSAPLSLSRYANVLYKKVDAHVHSSTCISYTGRRTCRIQTLEFYMHAGMQKHKLSVSCSFYPCAHLSLHPYLFLHSYTRRTRRYCMPQSTAHARMHAQTLLSLCLPH